MFTWIIVRCGDLSKTLCTLLCERKGFCLERKSWGKSTLSLLSIVTDSSEDTLITTSHLSCCGYSGAQIDFQDRTGLVRFPPVQGQSICQEFYRSTVNAWDIRNGKSTCECHMHFRLLICISKKSVYYWKHQQSKNVTPKWTVDCMNDSLNGRFPLSYIASMQPHRPSLSCLVCFCLACCWNSATDSVS